MTQLSANFSPSNVMRAMRSTAPATSPADPGPAPTMAPDQGGPSPRAKTFGRAMELAGAMYQVDKKGAVGLYWEALRAANTMDEVMRVVDVAFASKLDRLDPKLGMVDLGTSAMAKSIRLIATFDQGMDVAAALNGKGMGGDNHAKAALRRALAMATTADQAIAVAAFAKDNGRLLRYREIAEEAEAKARLLAANQGLYVRR